jgi:GDP-4-dehydro-6-deoxy-D-mannose reductase
MQMNLLEAVAAEAPQTRVLVVGSGDEYGHVEPSENPVSERQELRPLNPYAISKVAQDLMGYQYYASHGMHVIRVRPFVQIGPRRSDQFVAGSFARQVAEIQAGLAPAVIEVGNIDIERDITDVRDVVRAYSLLLDRGLPGEVYNLGSGRGTTIRQMLAAIMRAAGIEAEIRQEPQLRRTGEPVALIGDISKLEMATGWSPTISLQQSAADTFTYWRGQVAARARSAS